MALRGSIIENFDELWCLGASGGFDICVLFLTQKGTHNGHFGARDDQIIRIRKIFEANEVSLH